MTDTGKQVMYRWRVEKNKITVHFQDGKKLTGEIIDYDDTEIVLECQRGYTYAGKPTETEICQNWTWIEMAPPDSCHD